jgi:hypothetical protein
MLNQSSSNFLMNNDGVNLKTLDKIEYEVILHALSLNQNDSIKNG